MHGTESGGATQDAVAQALAERTRPRQWPASLRAEFRAAREEEHSHEAQFFAAMGLVIAIVTLFVDALVMPDRIVEASLNRVVFVIPLQLGVLALPRRYPRAQKLLLALSLTAFAMVLLRGSAWAPPPANAYLMMGTVVLLGVAIPIMPYTPEETAALVTAYIAGIAGTLYVFDAAFSGEAAFLAILIVTGGSTAVLAQRMWRMEARDFLLARQARDRLAAMEAANQRLSLLSQHDPLTGLANRRHAETIFARHFDSEPHAAEPRVAAMMIDLDHFKSFNDRWGHQTGDDCLRAVADEMRHAADSNGGLAARFGGEEFVILLRVDGPAQARAIAEALRVAIERIELRHAPTGDTATCSTSIGLAIHRDRAKPELAQLLSDADAALYRAKHAGRNRVELAA